MKTLSTSTSTHYHWGDIDPDGLAIAEHVNSQTPHELNLHLMTPDLAREFGSEPVKKKRRKPYRAGAPSTSDLAEFLESSDVRWLEQEAIDPERVLPA